MRTRELACSYCGAKPKEPCVLVLAPEVGPLSIPWEHGARERANHARLGAAL